jgi:hypothetical protein
LRAAGSAAGSECCDAGKIPAIFVDNSNHQKRSRQDRDKDQPPIAARFLRLVHLACARVLCCVNGGESAIVPMDRWRHRQSYLRRGFSWRPCRSAHTLLHSSAHRSLQPRSHQPAVWCPSCAVSPVVWAPLLLTTPWVVRAEHVATLMQRVRLALGAIAFEVPHPLAHVAPAAVLADNFNLAYASFVMSIESLA